ncbi:MAG: glutamate--tRNA ligase [Bacillota bacterium]|nr:glutamate--tRNA ligase [Bacillota bacterium]
MAPSPTGPIHLGNVHTSLFNWLFARQRQGVFVLRFEDTDAARSDPKWERVIYDELRWLGLDWDEAPEPGGPYGPYRQTERLHLYRDWARRLVDAGAAYECFCSVEELEAERAEAQSGGRSYQYSRKCRNLSPERRADLLAGGRQPSVRFAIPDGQTVVVDDIIRGRVEFPTSAMGDPIIMRPSGVPLYNFAVVVDDLTMKVTHVLRGEGHISNTPLQVLIYQALGERLPLFGHLGHITGGGGSKMSKRRGEGYIGFYREMGILPDAMFNYLALLGWTPGGDREILTRREILAEFDIGRVTPAPSQFDLEKLLWVNGHHIRRLSVDELARRCAPFLASAGLVPAEPTPAELEKIVGVVALEQIRIEYLQAIVDATRFFFQETLSYTPQAVKMIEEPGVRAVLATAAERLRGLDTWTVESLERAGAALLEQLGQPPRAVYQPIRASVTGRTASPPLFDTLYWIGRDWSLERLSAACAGRPLPVGAPSGEKADKGQEQQE